MHFIDPVTVRKEHFQRVRAVVHSNKTVAINILRIQYPDKRKKVFQKCYVDKTLRRQSLKHLFSNIDLVIFFPVIVCCY